MNAEHSPVNPSRRRLAKRGVVAAPVVLATLSSKNAFALAYQCFPSGKMSNNMSPFGPNPDRETNPSCRLNLTTSDATTGLNGTPTTINDTFAGVSVYRRPNGRLVTTASGNTPATLHDVLVGQNATGANQNPVPNLPLLKKAVVIYYNALNVTATTSTQALTQAQAVQLINARIAGNGTTLLTSIGPLVLSAQGVQQYFDQFAVL